MKLIIKTVFSMSKAKKEYEVRYTSKDAEKFSSKWPCSAVKGPGMFCFDNGWNLIDMRNRNLNFENNNNEEWHAFSEDCQKFAEEECHARSNI